MATLSLIAQLAAAALMAGIALRDAKQFRIPNAAVLAMLALYLVAQGALLFPDWTGDLFAGVLLFALGLVMWLLRALGAGDAKLMFPLGLSLGASGLMPFAILLMLVSILLYIAILISRLLKSERGLGGWFSRMKTEGRVPYGVPLALASVPVLIVQALWIG
ncbi:hypothetical protein AYJ57_25195 (plasmid) [Salipiger sp. CCB-MM3]|uniref:prepilin peptidase n=1 Tax=Salipiger sp. CCB-MM3 TaxID=1792508 RepID=UPI00080ABBF0|nr:prepilin peptidase [Salipiger sp. CCB-MM3]ANT63766.1 hypothetical protein AYJ57_25195 [Salipiger sp. CCB-MM3]